MPVIPAARSLFLCENYVKAPSEKVDLFSIFNSIRPRGGYPHTRLKFCVFAQLTNGLGEMPCFLDIRRASTDEVIYTWRPPTPLRFTSRMQIVNVAIRIGMCVFPGPGLYFVELFCDNSWVCDTRLLLNS